MQVQYSALNIGTLPPAVQEFLSQAFQRDQVDCQFLMVSFGALLEMWIIE